MYQPIAPPPPPEQFARELARFDRVAARWALLREALGERWTALASRDEERRAAVETGAIEGLYHLDEGVTQTLIREGLDSEAGRALDEGTFALISAQQHAIDLVTGSVVRDEPITASLIRELHQAVTAGRATYVARDQFGRQFRRELHRGEWKDQDNSVTLPDGSTLNFAPAVQVGSEVDRLVTIMAELEGAPWAYRGAVAHHLLTHIHPFADGNGRTARLLATHQFLRGGLPGLVVERPDKRRYLDALGTADRGSLSLFITFLASALAASLRRTEDRAWSSPVRDDVDADQVARALAQLTAARDTDLRAAAAVARVSTQVKDRAQQRMLEVIQPFNTKLRSLTVDIALGHQGVTTALDEIKFEAHEEFRAFLGVPDRGGALQVNIAVVAVATPTANLEGRLYAGFGADRALVVDLDDPDWPQIEIWLDRVISDALVAGVR